MDYAWKKILDPFSAALQKKYLVLAFEKHLMTYSIIYHILLGVNFNWFTLLIICVGKRKNFSRIHSKPNNIPWIRTGSHPYEKIMSSIVLYPVFYTHKNVQSLS